MRGEPGGMFGAPRGRAFHGDIFERRIKRGKLERGEVQDLACQAANAGSCFHYQKRLWRSEKHPHLSKLPGKQAPKNRMSVHAGVVIAEGARVRTGIVAGLG